jgi:hypothetical protein
MHLHQQVVAEAPRCNGLIEIQARRGNHPHVDVDVRLAAETRELALLKHVQQLRLQRQRQGAELVEKQRAVVGELEFSGFVLDLTAQHAALEPEELWFEQLGREGRAVDLHEGTA